MKSGTTTSHGETYPADSNVVAAADGLARWFATFLRHWCLRKSMGERKANWVDVSRKFFFYVVESNKWHLRSTMLSVRKHVNKFFCFIFRDTLRGQAFRIRVWFSWRHFKVKRFHNRCAKLHCLHHVIHSEHFSPLLLAFMFMQKAWKFNRFWRNLLFRSNKYPSTVCRMLCCSIRISIFSIWLRRRKRNFKNFLEITYRMRFTRWFWEILTNSDALEACFY